MHAGPIYVIGVLFVLLDTDRPEQFVLDHFRKAHHRIERRPQLMAHICQNFAFRTAGSVGLFFRRGKLFGK